MNAQPMACYRARANCVLVTFAQMRIAQVKRLEEMMEEELAQVEAQREGSEKRGEFEPVNRLHLRWGGVRGYYAQSRLRTLAVTCEISRFKYSTLVSNGCEAVAGSG